MKSPIPAAAVVCLICAQAQASDTAEARLAQCTGDGSATQQCVAWIVGWKAGYEIFRKTCIPDDATGTQLLEAFVDYAEANPDRLQENGRAVLKDALFARWPC
jgi:hypothetical protein